MVNDTFFSHTRPPLCINSCDLCFYLTFAIVTDSSIWWHCTMERYFLSRWDKIVSLIALVLSNQDGQLCLLLERYLWKVITESVIPILSLMIGGWYVSILLQDRDWLQSMMHLFTYEIRTMQFAWSHWTFHPYSLVQYRTWWSRSNQSITSETHATKNISRTCRFPCRFYCSCDVDDWESHRSIDEQCSVKDRMTIGHRVFRSSIQTINHRMEKMMTEHCGSTDHRCSWPGFTLFVCCLKEASLPRQWRVVGGVS